MAQPSPSPRNDSADDARSETQAGFSRTQSAAISSGWRLIRFGGRALDAAGEPVTGVAGVSFAIYAEQSGGAALWQETQNVVTDAHGRFSILLGAANPAGIPVGLFSSGESLWLAVLTHSPGVSEQPRILLVSVPYALQAADSDMLGGKPASAYRLENSQITAQSRCSESDALPTAEPASSLTAKNTANPAIAVTGAGAGYLPMFTNASGDIANSAVAQSGSNVGIGTTTPAFNLDVVSTTDPAAIAIEGYGLVGANFIGRRARGTLASPLPIQADDNIMTMQGRGYGLTSFSPSSRAFMKFFAAENWTDAAQGSYISLATTQIGTSPTMTPARERVRITDIGFFGIGTTAPDQMLTVNGSIHSTAGGFVFPDGSVMNTATTLPGLQQSGNLTLGAGNSIGGAGNLEFQTAGDTTNRMSDRLVIAGQPKTMSGPVPTANLFSVHVPTGEAAGGRVKFTIVASDGTNYAMETGEMIFLASPNQLTCAVVVSEYAKAPPGYTNTVLAIPPIGQIGSLNAQCSSASFGSDPGVQIFDTAPTSFTPTTHKVYYTIENQSRTALTLQP